MLRSILLLITSSFILGIYAQDAGIPEFATKFKAAKENLYNFKPEEALPILTDLYKKQGDNHNLEYLIGACYTDYDPESGKALEYLLRAKPHVVDDYDADDPTEKGASIHLYYFLAVAYAQTGKCDEAEVANEEFHSLIGKVGKAYLRDAQFWVDACRQLQVNDIAPTDVNDEKETTKNSDDLIENNKFVTQTVEYNTPTPLYGVQVGSFSKFMPSSSFEDIKNVDAFIDKQGKVRYVVGNFTFRNQAETLQKVLKESGYKDAFIVDVNKERKFSKKIITVNDVSINSKIRGKVHFRCQIGAFRDTIPEDMARKYLQISGIKENMQKDMTLMSVGHFPTYEEAKSFLSNLREVGINDAFVVAYNYDQKIPVKNAITYVSKQSNPGKKKKRK